MRDHSIHISTVDEDSDLVLSKELLVEWYDGGQQVSARVIHLTGTLTPAGWGWGEDEETSPASHVMISRVGRGCGMDGLDHVLPPQVPATEGAEEDSVAAVAPASTEPLLSEVDGDAGVLAPHCGLSTRPAGRQ